MEQQLPKKLEQDFPHLGSQKPAKNTALLSHSLSPALLLPSLASSALAAAQNPLCASQSAEASHKSGGSAFKTHPEGFKKEAELALHDRIYGQGGICWDAGLGGFSSPNDAVIGFLLG